MKKTFCDWTLGVLVIVTGALFQPSSVHAIDETFDLLQIGTQVFTNVTVTTKSKEYVIIHHAGGLTSLKTNELSEDALITLGYLAARHKPQTNAAAEWAKSALQIPVEQIKTVEKEVKTRIDFKAIEENLPFEVPQATTSLIAIVSGVLLLLYLFHCYCCMLICKKTGYDPGIWVWIPVIQLLPMLKAARMSRWWFLGYFVPGLNLIVQIIWSFKIADARDKSAIIGVFLLLPLFSLFAFLLLAFADKLPPRKEKLQARPVEIMTLETV